MNILKCPYDNNPSINASSVIQVLMFKPEIADRNLRWKVDTNLSVEAIIARQIRTVGGLMESNSSVCIAQTSNHDFAP